MHSIIKKKLNQHACLQQNDSINRLTNYILQYANNVVCLEKKRKSVQLYSICTCLKTDDRRRLTGEQIFGEQDRERKKERKKEQASKKKVISVLIVYDCFFIYLFTRE